MKRRGFIKALIGGASVIAAPGASAKHGVAKQAAKVTYLYTEWVAGTAYYDAAKVLSQLNVNEPLRLKREPTNEHDELAIEVLTQKGSKLGYLPRLRNHIPARLLDDDLPLTAVIERVREPLPENELAGYSYWNSIPGIKVKVFLTT